VVFAELVADNRPEQAYETGSVSTRIESIGLARAPRTAGRVSRLRPRSPTGATHLLVRVRQKG